jgi:hypothetical protein
MRMKRARWRRREPISSALMSAWPPVARSDVIVVARGGRFEDPKSVQTCYDKVDVHGFLGASSIGRLPIEIALKRTVAASGPKAPPSPKESPPMEHVILIGTLDTKGPEYEYIRTCLWEAGASVTLIDSGVLGEPDAIPDITAGEVA